MRGRDWGGGGTSAGQTNRAGLGDHNALNRRINREGERLSIQVRRSIKEREGVENSMGLGGRVQVRAKGAELTKVQVNEAGRG